MFDSQNCVFPLWEMLGTKKILAGGFKHFFIFTLKIGEDFQFDLRIFFRWVGKKPPTKNSVTAAFSPPDW